MRKVPPMAELVEGTFLKIIARVVVPASLAIGAFLGPRYIDAIVAELHNENLRLERRIDAMQEDLRYRREQNLSIQTTITSTLAEISKTQSAMQATLEIMAHRQDRLEDRMDGKGSSPR